MNVLICEAQDWERDAAQRLAPAYSVRCLPGPLDPEAENGFAEVEVLSTFIDSELTAAVLRRFTKLRLIATRSTGYDHIDLDYCRAAGVAVCNVPDYGDPTVAEHTFALLLALARKVAEAVERTRRGDFTQAGLRGFDLAGKTLGVVGTGRIGRRVIQIAKGFGLAVIAFDVHPDPSLQVSLGMRYVALAELLVTCDILTLHIPGGEGTRDLIGAEALARMKPSAVLVNTARGGVVNVEALIHALTEGRLAGAALDVLDEEPWLRDEAQIFKVGATLGVEGMRTLVANHALLKLPNVIVTPHIAYDTEEAVRRIMEITLGNIEAFLVGEPRNLVNGP
ncbi:2-hydroxyacid dehydrogenase [soil metagenome]